MRYQELAAKLRRLGCHEMDAHKGSHRKWLNPATGKATVIPDWGTKDLKTGTLHAGIRQLGIDWDWFRDA